MSLSATLGVFVALGAVLTLLVVVLRALKRFAPTFGGAKRLPMEVVQRLPLGPKHAIAVVRVGDRVLTVAIGDGGVQQLGEIEGADRDAVLSASTTPLPFTSSTPASAGILAALAANTELDRLPGGRAIRNALRRSTTRDVRATVPATTPSPAPARAPTPPPAGADAFRSMLGMALSSATKLALVGATLAALAWTPATAHAQPTTATRSTPATATGRNTQAPAGVGGATSAAPIAPGATAGAGVAGIDTMVARLAPQLDLRMGGTQNDGLRLSGTVGVVVMMGVLTLLPTLVLMMTGFTRILIVLQFLKQALGTQSAPPNHLVAAMALLLTGFVMAPTISTANETALQPWLAGRIEQTEMMRVGVRPFREFMLRQTRPADLKTFIDMSHATTAPRSADDVPLVVVMSAFVTSELRTAFQLGFTLFLPFIVIDIVVSSVLMSMGMMMLPPAMIALPCKLLLFVLVDGWSLVMQSIVASFK